MSYLGTTLIRQDNQNLFAYAYNCYRENESCYEILRCLHVMIDATLGHIPYLLGSFGGGRFVQTVLIEDMSHCYDIFGLHHVSVGCHTRAYPSNFAFTISRSNAQTSSSTYQAFKLRLHMDQMFRLHLHHIR